MIKEDIIKEKLSGLFNEKSRYLITFSYDEVIVEDAGIGGTIEGLENEISKLKFERDDLYDMLNILEEELEEFRR